MLFVCFFVGFLLVSQEKQNEGRKREKGQTEGDVEGTRKDRDVVERVFVLVLDGNVVGDVVVELLEDVGVGDGMRVELSQQKHKVIFGFAVDLLDKAVAHVHWTRRSRQIEHTGH